MLTLADGGWSLGHTCPTRCVKILVDSHIHELIVPCVRCLLAELVARLTYLRCTIDFGYFDGNSSALDTFQLSLQRSPLTEPTLAFQIIASYPFIRYIAIKVGYIEPLFWEVFTMESGEVVVDKAPKEDISVVMNANRIFVIVRQVGDLAANKEFCVADIDDHLPRLIDTGTFHACTLGVSHAATPSGRADTVDSCSALEEL
ncbi:hypothetical protein A0H81_08812 [Grifola frondosa]|uniref:Uncharacterized protein n=1 Tax=Grifola frondosa TaxID=5627 RepID=A0A1C7M9I5_GRIFR|nr:hypothetical protein A0H81_08812 [Grifola frondosa]